MHIMSEYVYSYLKQYHKCLSLGNGWLASRVYNKKKPGDHPDLPSHRYTVCPLPALGMLIHQCVLESSVVGVAHTVVAHISSHIVAKATSHSTAHVAAHTTPIATAETCFGKKNCIYYRVMKQINNTQINMPLFHCSIRP